MLFTSFLPDSPLEIKRHHLPSPSIALLLSPATAIDVACLVPKEFTWPARLREQAFGTSEAYPAIMIPTKVGYAMSMGFASEATTFATGNTTPDENTLNPIFF